MPGKSKLGASSLDPKIQQEIDDVLAGRSTALTVDLDLLGEMPQEVRELTGLRTLYLGGTGIERLPSWLNELPNLKEIDISEAHVAALPSFLPNVRWGVDAEQILGFGNRLDPSTVFSISLNDDTSQRAIKHVFDLGRSGVLELLEFSAGSAIAHGRGPRTIEAMVDIL